MMEQNIEIKPLSMWVNLEIKVNDSQTLLPFEANFITCNNKGYTNLTDKVPGKTFKWNYIDTIISPRINNSFFQEALRFRKPPRGLGS